MTNFVIFVNFLKCYCILSYFELMAKFGTMVQLISVLSSSPNSKPRPKYKVRSNSPENSVLEGLKIYGPGPIEHVNKWDFVQSPNDKQFNFSLKQRMREKRIYASFDNFWLVVFGFWKLKLFFFNDFKSDKSILTILKSLHVITLQFILPWKGP